MARSPEAGGSRGPVAFLFLGETLLIPHLWPIVDALSKHDVAIDCWVATATHERLLTRWSPGMTNVRIRRAPGFRDNALPDGHNPELPAKLPMLARLAPKLWRTPVAICAEQTSLWLPRLLPMPTRFLKTSHGVGSMSARDDPRRRAAWKMLVPSERERATYLERGFAADRVVATGYVKSSFRADRIVPQFVESRPVILYAPHWQRHRSSWWDWGPDIVRRIAHDGRWNLIFAPHQRLAEQAGDVREIAGSLAGLPNVHTDLDSFATVDGSYTAAADIYLGDTSSQVIEFLANPRPCVFLNVGQADWRTDPAYAQWACGEVVEALDDVLPTLAQASAKHARFAEIQSQFAQDSLGDTSGAAPERIAGIILEALNP